MPVSHEEVARLITAAHLGLFRDSVTAGEIASAASQAANAVLTLLDATGPAEPEPGEFRHLVAVSLIGAPALVGRVEGTLATDGELHTVRVRWPNGEVHPHHPSELEVAQ